MRPRRVGASRRPARNPQADLSERQLEHTSARADDLGARVLRELYRAAALMRRAPDAGAALIEIGALIERGQWESTLDAMRLPSSTAPALHAAEPGERHHPGGWRTSIREARQMLSDSKSRRPPRERSHSGGSGGDSGRAGAAEAKREAPPDRGSDHKSSKNNVSRRPVSRCADRGICRLPRAFLVSRRPVSGRKAILYVDVPLLCSIG
jgi:hypothetical protein